MGNRDAARPATRPEPEALAGARSVAAVLREYVDERIAGGQYPPESWLPSVRDLSATLRVHRNTVSKVYQSLERDGVAKRIAGRGMRVVGRPATRSSADARLERAAELLVREAIEARLSRDRVDGLLDRVEARLRADAELRLAFVECNREAASSLARDLSAQLSVPVDPLLVTALREGDRRRRPDLVVTTFFHLHEVAAALGSSTRVVGVNHQMSYETILEIAQFGPRTRLVVVCPNARTLERVERTVRSYTQSQVVAIRTDEKPDVPAALDGADAAVVAWGTHRLVRRIRPDLRLITVKYHVDAQSVAEVRRCIEQVVMPRVAPRHAGRPRPAKRGRTVRTRVANAVKGGPATRHAKP